MRRMKDSGIAWIGEIPEEWEIKKLKYITYCNKNTLQENTDAETRINYIDISSVSELYGIIETQEFNFHDAPSRARRIVHCGDVIISTVRTYLRAVSYIEKIYDNYICSTGFAVLTPMAQELSSKFMYYTLFSDFFVSTVEKLSVGISYPAITAENLHSIRIPVPPLPEQHRIADYLDAKCAEIDSSMELVRQGMDKLKAYKMSVITEAVTKGLDPDVPMKDSGVPWIGEMPEGWKISSVRWEFDNLDGRRRPISAENRVITHGSYDYYGASGIIDKIDEYIFDEPLILIGEDGANLALRNLPLIYIATGKYWVNNHAHILKPKAQNALYYMAYQLECVDLFHFITGSTQPKLTQANLSKIPVVCPSLAEQLLIIAHIDTKCAEIDAVIAQKQELLDKLAAYKKSLIFECVTGKREVAA